MITPMPSNLKLEETPNSFTIRRRWFSAGHIFILFFSLAWNGILLLFYTMMLSVFNQGDSGLPSLSGEQLIFFLFPVIHVIVGLGLFYYGICGLVNTTRISANHKYLTLKHTPLYWPGARKIRVHEIRQLYCEEVQSRRQYSNSDSSGGVTYKVNVITANFTKIKLVAHLTEKDQALFIERTIEDRLGIKDEQVEGEVKKEV